MKLKLVFSSLKEKEEINRFRRRPKHLEAAPYSQQGLISCVCRIWDSECWVGTQPWLTSMELNAADLLCS